MSNTVTASAIAIAIQNAYTTALGPRKRTGNRSADFLRAKTTQPAMRFVVLYHTKLRTFRVEKAGAWIEDDEESFPVEITANTRGMDLEKRAAEIATEITNLKS